MAEVGPGRLPVPSPVLARELVGFKETKGSTTEYAAALEYPLGHHTCLCLYELVLILASTGWWYYA